MCTWFFPQSCQHYLPCRWDADSETALLSLGADVAVFLGEYEGRLFCEAAYRREGESALSNAPLLSLQATLGRRTASWLSASQQSSNARWWCWGTMMPGEQQLAASGAGLRAHHPGWQ